MHHLAENTICQSVASPLASKADTLTGAQANPAPKRTAAYAKVSIFESRTSEASLKREASTSREGSLLNATQKANAKRYR